MVFFGVPYKSPHALCGACESSATAKIYHHPSFFIHTALSVTAPFILFLKLQAFNIWISLLLYVISYLLPLSYGTPAALGACEFFEVKANTIKVAM